MTKDEKAVELFEKYNCAQSVFAACGPELGLAEQTCFVIAGPFGGGMGRTGQTCGALTGALMALGQKCGQQMAADPASARGPLYDRVSNVIETFRTQHGAITCRELTGCDMRTPAGQADFKSRDLHHTLCRKLVASAVKLVDEQ